MPSDMVTNYAQGVDFPRGGSGLSAALGDAEPVFSQREGLSHHSWAHSVLVGPRRGPKSLLFSKFQGNADAAPMGTTQNRYSTAWSPNSRSSFSSGKNIYRW